MNDVDKNMENKHGEFVKVLMITKSGSEGLSLRNIRQVHIMEPYWNNIRTQQVIGRAIRAHSHIDLPKSERIVDTYLYIMRLSNTQKKKEKETTDEHIYNISLRKAKLNSSFLNILKGAAIDCKINNNRKKNMNPVSCFEYHSVSQIKDSVYFRGDIKDDVVYKHKSVKLHSVKNDDGTQVKHLNRNVYIDVNSKLLYTKEDDNVPIGEFIDNTLIYYK